MKFELSWNENSLCTIYLFYKKIDTHLILVIKCVSTPTTEISNANDDPVLHDIVVKMRDTRSLWNRQSFLSLRHFPDTHGTASLWVAVDRNGICKFLLCRTSPKRTLHQVYELLLIEMELIHRNLNIPNKESYSQFNQLTELII